MPQPTFVTLEEAVANMARWFYYRTGLRVADLPGDITRTLFEAVGFESEQRSRAFDAALQEGILEAAYSAFNLKFDPPQVAQVVLTFSRATPAPEDYPIPRGTRAQTEGGYVFETAEDAVLAQGQTAQSVRAVALAAGSAYNVPAGAIRQLLSAIPGIEAVVNNQAASGGRDETDQGAKLEQLSRYLASLAKGTKAALEAAALSVSVNGERATLVTATDAYIDAGQPLGYATVYVYRPGGASSNLLEAIRTRLAEEQRPVGILLRVLPVQVVPVDVNVQVIGSAEVRLSRVEDALRRFFENLKIGEDVNLERLKAALLESDPGVYTVHLNSPSAPVTVTPYARAELGTVNITLTVGGPT